MANYTAADIKALRERTGAGMMDCKKALDEANGDVEKAIELHPHQGPEGRRQARRPLHRRRPGCRQGRRRQPSASWSSSTARPTSSPRATSSSQLADKVLAVAVESRRRRPRDAAGGRRRRQDRGRRSSTRKRHPGREGRRPSRGPRRRRAPSMPTCTRRPRTCRRRSASSSQSTAKATAAEAAHDVAQHIAAFAPKYLSRDEVPAEIVENERRIAEETTRAEGKPEAALAEDRRGPPERLLQAGRAARPAVREGQQEVRRQGAGRGRRHPDRVRPLQASARNSSPTATAN